MGQCRAGFDPVLAPGNTGLAPTASAHQADDKQQDDGARRCVDEGPENPGSQMNAEAGQQQIANEGADDSDGDIANDAKTRPANDMACKPTSDQADEDNDDQALLRKIHVLS